MNKRTSKNQGDYSGVDPNESNKLNMVDDDNVETTKRQSRSKEQSEIPNETKMSKLRSAFVKKPTTTPNKTQKQETIMESKDQLLNVKSNEKIIFSSLSIQTQAKLKNIYMITNPDLTEEKLDEIINTGISNIRNSQI